MEGLHGRKPIFKSHRDLALSYFDPFIDQTGWLTGYAVANLDDIRSSWRDSSRQVWKVVDHLIKLKHSPLRVSARRHKKWFDHYKKTGESGSKQPSWW